MENICPDSLLNLYSSCSRAFWEGTVPSAVFLFLLVKNGPVTLPDSFKPFTTFLPLREAESLLHLSGQYQHPLSLWRPKTLMSLSLLQSILTLTDGVLSPRNLTLIERFAPFTISSTYLYAAFVAARRVQRSNSTPPYGVFVLYVAHFTFGIISICSQIYDHHILGASWPSGWIVARSILNIIIILCGLLVILGMPLIVPSAAVDPREIGDAVSLEDYTTLWGWMSFSWVKPLLVKGNRMSLNERDVWNMSVTNQSRPLFLKFAQTATLVSKLGSSNKWKLIYRIWVANKFDVMLDVVLSIASIIFNYAGPFFLRRILEAIAQPTPESRWTAYVYAFLAFLCSLIVVQADLQHLWFSRRALNRTSSELMAAIYEKSLKRKDFSGASDTTHDGGTTDAATTQKSNAHVGKIVNLMSGDVNVISRVFIYAYWFYGTPIEIAVACTFLYNLIGWAGFTGMMMLLVAAPLSTFITKRVVAYNKKRLSAVDKRMGILTELVNQVKAIKFYAWDNKWVDKVRSAREHELSWFVKQRIMNVLFSFLWDSIPSLISVISFSIYVLSGHELTIPVAFASVAIFNMLTAPLTALPYYIAQLMQVGASVDRIADFLAEDEVSDAVSSLKRNSATLSAEADFLGLERASCQWNSSEPVRAKRSTSNNTLPSGPMSTEDTNRFELRDINVIFPAGRLSVVTGATASGKTALLMALLGEMDITDESTIIYLPKNGMQVDERGLRNAVSFAAQSPWLQNMSIRNNILFGSPYEKERYEEVLRCCALEPDLAVLEDGGETEIGANGVSLSGGQKARVALARAVYSRAKHVLLDDPLSAVDSHTARFLFENLFCGSLMQYRTVVLVTHHVGLVLPTAHYYVRMAAGRIELQGIVEDLVTCGKLEAMDATTAPRSVERPSITEEPVVATLTPVDKHQGQPRKLVEDEVRPIGSVKWTVYHTYLNSSSYLIWTLIVLLILAYELVLIGQKVVLKIWGESYDTSVILTNVFSLVSAPGHGVLSSSNLPQSNFRLYAVGCLAADGWPCASEHPMYYVGVYAGVGVAIALLTTLSRISDYIGALRASRTLFNRLLDAVVGATMRWYDVTPTGRILNRLSRDIEVVDTSVADSTWGTGVAIFTFVASVIFIAAMLPGFLVPGILIGWIFVSLSVPYLNTSRDLQRMTSTARSPIFSTFKETLEGVATIRAFGSELRLLNELHEKIDGYTKMTYNFWMLNRYLLVRFDSLGGLTVLATTLFSLSGAVSSGIAALTITTAISYTRAVYWTCRQITQLEVDLNSVERVVEYLELPQEPPRVIESSRPPAYWPSTNDSDSFLVVKDLVVRYAPDLPAVIRGISFSLKAKEKIGLLGRTGSGKSTLAMSLLRFTDPSEGTISLDGIDITKIGLHDLRSRMGLLTQDPALFTGTIRENLDPFREHDDEECLSALRRVHLITDKSNMFKGDTIKGAPLRDLSGTTAASSHAGMASEATTVNDDDTSTIQSENRAPVIDLDTKVSASGSNFSQGQRQLIAMARALLRPTAIAIFDEPSASVDFETDGKLQKTVREEFKNACLITIAHRISTIIDYDRLIIMDNGTIAEFDTPAKLIQKEGGIFREMCLQSGMFKQLEEAALAKDTI